MVPSGKLPNYHTEKKSYEKNVILQIGQFYKQVMLKLSEQYRCGQNVEYSHLPNKRAIVYSDKVIAKCLVWSEQLVMSPFQKHSFLQIGLKS